MHELLLYGQVPFARHDQVLKILAGVAAMQPHRVLERHIIYKPVRQPMEPGYHLGRGGGSQNVEKGKPAQAKSSGAKDLYYQQLVQKLDDDVFGGGDGPQQPNGKTLSAEVKDGEEHKWSLEFYDLPDTGDKGVSIRMTHSTHLLSGDPHAWMVAIGPHQFVTEYFIEGHRFVHGNVIIFLHRILHEPGVRSLQTTPKIDLPAFTSLKPVDPSGSFILEAKVRVKDRFNPTVLDSGVRELLGFQQRMKGCVELALPDRLSLDTRVKYEAPPPPVVRKVR